MVNIPQEIGFMDKITFDDNVSAKKVAKVFAGKSWQSCLKVLKLVNYILLLILNKSNTNILLELRSFRAQ